MLAGFFLAWGVLIVGWIVASILLVLVSNLPSLMGSTIAPLIFLLPQAGLLGVLVWAVVKGRTRTALGILAAVGSMMALALLLVAACFGMLATTNWH